jgi:hypothetical protein
MSASASSSASPSQPPIDYMHCAFTMVQPSCTVVLKAPTATFELKQPTATFAMVK